MPEVFRKVLLLLSPRERKNAYLLLGMILVMAFLDVVGIASIMPFMAVLANPDLVESSPYLQAAFVKLGFTDRESFLFFLGVVVFMAMMVSIIFKAATTWTITQFTQMRNYSIARRLMATYLRQPYEWFLGRHSADLGKTVLSEVEAVVGGAVVPLMLLIAHGTVVIAILCLLVAVDPFLTLLVGVGMGGAYAVTYLALRQLLDRTGNERLAANEMRFKVVSETFGGIKDVKLGAYERSALERFDSPAKRLARARVVSQIVAMMPRFALEIIAFGGMLLLILFLIRRGEGLQGALPIMALFAVSGYRLMPALQVSYDQATKLRFSGPALERLHQDLQSGVAGQTADGEQDELIELRRSICLDAISYSYPNSERPAVENLSLEICARSTVGIVGATGSGKTTTVDVILGLLNAQSGSLRVDEVEITQLNNRAWQRMLGYVPQQIFLADESVAANIAFGVQQDKIDSNAVERAARVANLHQFVVDELPNGYDTLVGERGVRLSGGQRQRIGIARALYHQPKVLVLDEATSALDNVTEQIVMEAVHNIGGEITIVLIAHRLTTVRECDRIFVLEHGRLKGEGTYDELNANNASFRAMTSA